MKKDDSYSEEEDLYNILESNNPKLTGSMHIHDMGDYYRKLEGEGTFRVYHHKGYCFEVEKSVACYDNDNEPSFVFQYYNDTDEFKKINVKKALHLVMSWINC